MHFRFCMHQHFDLIIYPFKCKCFYIFVSKLNGECQILLMNHGFNTIKVNGSTHVKILIIQECEKTH